MSGINLRMIHLDKHKKHKIRLERARTYLIDINNYLCYEAEDLGVEYDGYIEVMDSLNRCCYALEKTLKALEMVKNKK